MARRNPYGLTDLQSRFVQEYLLDLNGSAAYQRAGYTARGNVAEAAASRLLRHVKVGQAIQEAQAQRSHRTHITQDTVLEEIAILEHSSIEHYHVDERGNVTLAPGAPPNALRAISGLKKKIIYTESGVIFETEFKLWNKPAALRMGGEHVGVFTPAAVQLPDIHVHVHTARERLATRITRLAARHAEEATNGH